MERVFVSHSHADNHMVATFVRDLWDAGVDVWVDLQDIAHGQFMDRINAALKTSKWFVLVLSPASLSSDAVKTEMNAAIGMTWSHEIQDIVPIVGKPIEENTIPGVWRTYHRYDAVKDGYVAAFQGLLRALGKTVVVPRSVRESGQDTKGIPAANDAIVQEVKLRNLHNMPVDSNLSQQPPPMTSITAARQQAQEVHELVNDGRWLTAITIAKDAIQKPENLQDATLWGDYGFALIRTGERKKGVEMLTKALQLADGRADLWNLKAQTLAEEGDLPGAITAWEKAFTRSTTEGRLAILADQYQAQMTAKDTNAARQTCQLARELAPNDPDWQQREKDVQIAGLQAEYERLTAAQQWDAAIALIDRILQIVPNDVTWKSQRQQMIATKEAAQRKQREEEQRRRQQAEAEQLARILPTSLQTKGFTLQVNNGIDVITPPMVTIPFGDFLMGSDKKKDTQAQGNELPQQTITVDEYAIGTYPLTVAEYACFVRATNRNSPREDDYSHTTWEKQLQRLDHPVVNITWNDMLAYVQWLAQVTGQPYRMPTEAEWEKAARGTDGRIYPWGNQWDKTKANTYDGGPRSTTPVGSYPQGASPYGCMDMAGNVWQWTSTIYVAKYPYKNDIDHENNNSTNNRMLRGGSWDYNPEVARAAYRDYYAPDIFNYNRGGRVARARLSAGS